MSPTASSGDDREHEQDAEGELLAIFFNDGSMKIADYDEDDAWIRAAEEDYVELGDGWSQ